MRKYKSIKYGQTSADSDLLYISPKQINYFLLDSSWLTTSFSDIFDPYVSHEHEKGRFRPSCDTGIVLGGDWDKYKKYYKYDRVYRGWEDHHIHGVPWEETEMFQQYKIWSVVENDPNLISDKISEKKNLNDAVEENGYKTQYELGEKDQNTPVYKNLGK